MRITEVSLSVPMPEVGAGEQSIGQYLEAEQLQMLASESVSLFIML